MTGKQSGTKVDLVGHSMGGLVARAAIKDWNKNKINQLITVGSPNKGSAIAYGTWEAADFSDQSGFGSVALQTILRLKSNTFDNQREVIQTEIPSILNLFPTDNFLFDKNGHVIDIKRMVWRNNFLPTLNKHLPDILTFTSTISGNGYDTLKSMEVKPPGKYDKLWGNWTDGLPTDKFTDDGDGVVLVSGVNIPNAKNNISLNQTDHGELVSSSTGQAEILSLLNTNGTTFETSLKMFSKSIVVTVASPVTFKVLDPNNLVYTPSQGILVIDNPVDGNYKVTVTSIGTGHYHLFFGRLANGNSAWEDNSGEFKLIGQNKTFSYTVDFNDKYLGGDPYSDAIKRLNYIKEKEVIKNISKNFLNHMINELKLLKNDIFHKSENTLLSLIQEINFSVLTLHKFWGFSKYKPEMINDILEQMRLVKLDVAQISKYY